MKYLNILLFVLFLVSCSSAPKKTTIDLPDDFDDIKNEDFTSVVEVPYRSHLDNFKENQAITDDSLAKESLGRFSEKRLEPLIESGDPISKSLGMCYRGETQEGLKNLDGNIEKYQKHPSFWTAIGTCYYLRKEFRKALLFYNKTIEVDSNYAPSYNNLGVLYMRDNLDQKALVAFQKAAKLNPFSLTPIFNLAFLYLEYGHIKKAETYFKSLHNQYPQDKDVLIGRATTYLFQNKIESALKLYSQLDSDYTERPDVGLNFAVGLFLSGNKNKASDIFEDINVEKLGRLKPYYDRVKKLIGDKS
ncbi:MAG: tetratricopeptide repeat protein [Bacteriovoracaceae bacterium]|jgi:tetratricopeptide (TPR) repeat protein|nr:tetratricopeptide repeat protein [Bacteriovoracaceae bacterium]